MSNPELFIKILLLEKENAKKAFERRLFIIIGDDKIDTLLNELPSWDKESFLIVSNNKNLIDAIDIKGKTAIKHKETGKILGRTFDNALIDLRDHLDVISLSRSIETVKGGGIIIVLLPFSYLSSPRYIEKLKPIGIEESPRDLLRRRIILKAMKYPGIHLFSSKSVSFISSRIKEPNGKRGSLLKYPKHCLFDQELYKICLSQDQIDVLKKMENLDDINCLLITSNRGRGKSAIIGVGLVGYAQRRIKQGLKKLSVAITAPERENVLEIFRFLEISHEKLNLAYTSGNSFLESDIIVAEYLSPFDILNRKADIIVVDEAAGIQFPLLKKIVSRFSKIIFSTTIHGYEGAGRTFSTRFIPLLKKEKENFEWMILQQPIRYAENDPIEKWLYDVLLFDAEPKDISKEYARKKLDETKLIKYDPRTLIFNDNKLRQYFGILVTAHYRNNPNDLLMLADAPHHLAFALSINDNIIVSLQISKEGGIPEDQLGILYETSPTSHIIPDKIFKYHGAIDFPKYKGWRIIRIATHHNLMRMGFGSKALEELEKCAKKEKVSWIGAGFSAYPELLNFWIKNKYLPVHLSPKVNKKTGEHTVIVVKPIDDTLSRIIVNANLDLRVRLLDELSTTYKYLNPETALLILKGGEKIVDFKLYLTQGQLFRLSLYLKKTLHFESASDAISQVVKYYFAKKMNLLNSENEKLLIEGVLQRKKVGIQNLLKIRSLINTLWENIVIS